MKFSSPNFNGRRKKLKVLAIHGVGYTFLQQLKKLSQNTQYDMIIKIYLNITDVSPWENTIF